MSDKVDEAKRCPNCGFELHLRQSSFEQYEPSDYVCEKCSNQYSPTYISGFRNGYERGQQSQENEIKKVYQMLSIHGVSEERTKGSIANGISVLVTRVEKEIHFLEHEKAELQASNTALRELLDKFCLKSQCVTVMYRGLRDAGIPRSKEAFGQKLESLYAFQCEVEQFLAEETKTGEPPK